MLQLGLSLSRQSAMQCSGSADGGELQAEAGLGLEGDIECVRVTFYVYHLTHLSSYQEIKCP